MSNACSTRDKLSYEILIYSIVLTECLLLALSGYQRSKPLPLEILILAMEDNQY